MLELNPAWERILGYSPDELRQKPFIDFVHPEDRASTIEIVEQVFSGRDIVHFQNRYRHKKGHWVPLEWHATARGGVAFGVARDVTVARAHREEMEQSELRAQRSYEELRELFDSMSEGVVMQERGGAIIASNRAAEQILGLTADQMRGRTSVDPRWESIREDFEPFPGNEHPAMVCLASGQPVDCQIMGVRKPDGSLTWISIHSRPIFEKHGALRYVSSAPFATLRGISLVNASEMN